MNSNLLTCILMESSESDKVLMEFIQKCASGTSIALRRLPFLFFCGNIPHVRIGGFHEEWIDLYLESNLFRMTRATWQKLWIKIQGPAEPQFYQGGGIPVPGEIQLLITLWWLGKGETLLSVSEKFNVALSTVYIVTSKILNKLLILLNEYIMWPNSVEEFQYIEEGFRSRCGYPGVIGAIDGSNIRIKAPLNDQDSYIDKNENHSIKIQAVCTHNKIFTNIVVGFPGSVHDARIFRNSQLYLDVTANGQLRKYFPLEEYYLVADKAYPLSNWIMKPYIGEERLLNHRQRNFNVAHSRTRIVVEHSFGLLKGRWLILKYINVNSIEKAVKIVSVCCILHNFCYLNGDNWTDNNVHFEDFEENDMGIVKRDNISRLL